MSTSPLIASLAERLDQTIRPLLDGNRECALLDFPNHSNVGDSAIWLAEERFLGGTGMRVVYRCGWHDYSAPRLASRIGNGPILLSGGGNFGDLWPEHQEFRERVIKDFPANAIIQLPQSICFMSSERLAQARTVLNAHERLTILVRDMSSLDIARNAFRATSELCPDMTFALGPLARPAPSVVPILWLKRSDIESKPGGFGPADAGVERRDWLNEEPGPFGRIEQLLASAATRFPRLFGSVSAPALYQPWHQRLAAERLGGGLNLLARGRVVITDRLHGYLLSLLMDIPHVVLDNSYGKVSAFHSAWTRSSSITHWASSPEEAVHKARALVG